MSGVLQILLHLFQGQARYQYPCFSEQEKKEKARIIMSDIIKVCFMSIF